MSAIGVSANRLEILQIAKAVAEEKSIDQKIVIEAMQEAIEKAAKAKYGQEHDIRAMIDPMTGEQTLLRVLTVVTDEEFEDEAKQLRLVEAKKIDPSLEIGSELTEELPPFDFGRVAAQTAKQVIMQKVRDAERERQYDEFKDRIGEVIVGEVKRMEHGNVLVDLGRSEAIVRREDLIPREIFRPKDRIRAYIYDVRHESRGPQIFLSRAHPQFMAKLFEQEVPEIYDGVIEIRAVARDPGSRAKIAVISKDSSIDPVGACVGMRGSRVQAVVQELMGEKVDIIPWSSDQATFIVNALAPAEVSKVVLDPDAQRIEVIVPDHMQHIAIGRRGQNVRLASQLSGWDIDIVSETEESERRNREFRQTTSLLTEALNVEEVIAQLLATEGYSSVEEIAETPLEELANIQGFDEEIAEALRERAAGFLEEQEEALVAEADSVGLADDLREFDLLDLQTAVDLAKKGVKTLEDLADLSGDEFIELLPDVEVSSEEAGGIILAARVVLGWIEPEPEEDGLEAEAAGDGDAADADGEVIGEMTVDGAAGEGEGGDGAGTVDGEERI